MKILLVYCNSMLENAMPIGLTQLSACLKAAGHEVCLFDTTFYRWGTKSDMENRIEALQIMPCPLDFKEGDMHADFARMVRDVRPDMVGFSIVEPTFHMGIDMVRIAKSMQEELGFTICAGGVHAVIAPETFEPHAGLLDFICISEGEVAFVELCHKLETGAEYRDQAGFWFSDGKDWRKNPRAPLVDLDTLPFLDLELFPESYMNKPMMGRNRRTIVLETTRGCPYHCSYCCDHTLKELFADQGRWYRKKSIERIELELDHFVKKYDPEFLYVMSESFLAGSLERVSPILETLKKYRIPFWFNTRPEDITPEKLQLAKEANLMRVSIGVEAGNQEFRIGKLHRNLKNETIVHAANLLNEFGISFSVNIIIGFPFETRDMVFESVELCKQLKADAISTHIFNPYHGTEMRDICVQNGMIDKDMIADDFFQRYALSGNTLTAEEVRGLFRTIPLYGAMPEERYEEIRLAESATEEGDRIWKKLRGEFYQIKGWPGAEECQAG